MWGEGEEQIQLVLRLGMFLARVPLPYYYMNPLKEYTQEPRVQKNYS